MRRASSRTGPGRARHRPRGGAWTRRANSVRSGVVTGSAYKHQVVPMDDQVGHVLGQLVGAAPDPLRPPGPPAGGPGPWRRPCRPGPTISTASSGPKSPSAATTPAGSSDRPPSARAWLGPLVDHQAARGPQGEGDPQLAGREAVGPGPEHGAHAGLAGHGGRDDAGSAGVGDDRLHARPGGDLGRGHLRGHAAAARPRCRARRPSARAGGRSRPPPRSARPRRTGGDRP